MLKKPQINHKYNIPHYYFPIPRHHKIPQKKRVIERIPDKFYRFWRRFARKKITCDFYQKLQTYSTNLRRITSLFRVFVQALATQNASACKTLIIPICSKSQALAIFTDKKANMALIFVPPA